MHRPMWCQGMQCTYHIRYQKYVYNMYIISFSFRINTVVNRYPKWIFYQLLNTKMFDITDCLSLSLPASCQKAMERSGLWGTSPPLRLCPCRSVSVPVSAPVSHKPGLSSRTFRWCSSSLCCISSKGLNKMWCDADWLQHGCNVLSRRTRNRKEKKHAHSFFFILFFKEKVAHNNTIQI